MQGFVINMVCYNEGALYIKRFRDSIHLVSFRKQAFLVMISQYFNFSMHSTKVLGHFFNKFIKSNIKNELMEMRLFHI